MTRTRVLRATVAAATLTLLTACGADHPGAAASVGGTPVSVQDVDALAQGFCRLDSRPDRPAVRMSQLRVGWVHNLVLSELATKYAQAHHIRVDPSTRNRAMAQMRRDAQGLPAAQRAGFEEAAAKLVEGYAAQQAVGQRVMARQGMKGSGPDQAANAAAAAIAKWRQRAGVRVDIDPRFSTTPAGRMDGGSVSRPVSQGALDAGNGGSTDGVPESQLCAAPGQ